MLLNVRNLFAQPRDKTASKPTWDAPEHWDMVAEHERRKSDELRRQLAMQRRYMF